MLDYSLKKVYNNIMCKLSSLEFHTTKLLQDFVSSKFILYICETLTMNHNKTINKLTPDAAKRIEGLKECTKGLLTVSKYAKKRKLNRRTVYNMCADYRLLSITIGGVLYIIP